MKWDFFGFFCVYIHKLQNNKMSNFPTLQILTCIRLLFQAEKDPAKRETRMLEYQKQIDTFNSIFDQEQHRVLVERGNSSKVSYNSIFNNKRGSSI